MNGKLNLIELTEAENGFRLTVNVNNIEFACDFGNKTKIVCTGNAYIVKETYDEIKSFLNQMV